MLTSGTCLRGHVATADSADVSTVCIVREEPVRLTCRQPKPLGATFRKGLDTGSVFSVVGGRTPTHLHAIILEWESVTYALSLKRLGSGIGSCSLDPSCRILQLHAGRDVVLRDF